MTTIKRIFLFLAFFISFNTFGQKECNLYMLTGEWNMINLIHWGVHSNVDSLKSISLSYKSDIYATIEFTEDSTYTIRSTINNRTKTMNGYYRCDKKKCELIMCRKRNSLKNTKKRERSNWEIIYIGNEILIYKENNNPKGVATHVLMKK